MIGSKNDWKWNKIPDILLEFRISGYGKWNSDFFKKTWIKMFALQWLIKMQLDSGYGKRIPDCFGKTWIKMVAQQWLIKLHLDCVA